MAVEIVERCKGLVAGLAALALALSALSCDGDDGTSTGPPDGSDTGALRVITITSGDTLDPDGYTVTVDASESGAAEPNDTLVFAGLSPGDHGVEASDIAVNCGTGTAANPRVLTVAAGDTTTTTFDIGCLPALFDHIVFEADRLDGSVDLLAVRLDGTDPIELTTTGNFARPSVSPDGTRLAFMSFATAPDDNEVFVMNIDGTGIDNLTDNTVADGNPDWSPDGERVVFETDRDGNQEIYVMDADGSNPIRVTNDPAADFRSAWSPGGNLIAFTRTTDGFDSREIFAIEVDGTGPVNLTDNTEADQHPEWSPDGGRILFEGARTGDRELFLMDPDGSNVVPLTATPGERETTARFAPDGGRIAFASDADGDFDLYTMNADGTDVQRLTDLTGDELFPVWTPMTAQR